MADILIIDDDMMMCNTMERIVTHMGHTARSAHTLKKGRNMVSIGSYDVVLLDVLMPDGSGLDLVPQIRHVPDAPEIIIITSLGNPEGAELAIRNGAWDYVEKPFSKQDIVLQVSRALEYRTAKTSRKDHSSLKRDNIIGNSPAISSCLDLVADAAESEATVLIQGETGSGKELFARTIHDNSARKDNDFIIVDCAAIPGSLIESLLFGNVKGAFTGADRDKTGLVKLAHRGTLFLDEVGELPLKVQKVFLRVLQERRFRPVGSHREVVSDFRLVAATNRNLEHMAAEGTFRKDLLYRLQQVTIAIPPLNQRPEDIRELTREYVARIYRQAEVPPKSITPDFFKSLCVYTWPGNVRELFNTLERALAAAGNDSQLVPLHLPDNIRIHQVRTSLGAQPKDDNGSAPVSSSGEVAPPETMPLFKEMRSAELLKIEYKYFRRLIALADGDIRKACAISGLGRSYLYGQLKKHGLRLSR